MISCYSSSKRRAYFSKMLFMLLVAGIEAKSASINGSGTSSLDCFYSSPTSPNLTQPVSTTSSTRTSLRCPFNLDPDFTLETRISGDSAATSIELEYGNLFASSTATGATNRFGGARASASARYEDSIMTTDFSGSISFVMVLEGISVSGPGNANALLTSNLSLNGQLAASLSISTETTFPPRTRKAILAIRSDLAAGTPIGFVANLDTSARGSDFGLVSVRQTVQFEFYDSSGARAYPTFVTESGSTYGYEMIPEPRFDVACLAVFALALCNSRHKRMSPSSF